MAVGPSLCQYCNAIVLSTPKLLLGHGASGCAAAHSGSGWQCNDSRWHYYYGLE
jgi:hypothetical protein